MILLCSTASQGVSTAGLAARCTTLSTPLIAGISACILSAILTTRASSPGIGLSERRRNSYFPARFLRRREPMFPSAPVMATVFIFLLHVYVGQLLIIRKKPLSLLLSTDCSVFWT